MLHVTAGGMRASIYTAPPTCHCPPWCASATQNALESLGADRDCLMTELQVEKDNLQAEEKQVGGSGA